MTLIGLTQTGRAIWLADAAYTLGGAPTTAEAEELHDRAGDEYPAFCTFPTTEDEEECGYSQNGMHGTLCQIHGERVAAGVSDANPGTGR